MDNIFIPSQEIANLPCITEIHTQECKTYVNEYLSQVQISSQISQEYQDLIKEFLISTQISGDPFLMDYFQLKSIETIKTLPNIPGINPNEIQDFNNDPNFSAVKLYFETYKDPEDPHIYQEQNQYINIQCIKEEFLNWFIPEDPDLTVYFDFNSSTESLTIYTICY